MTTLRSHFPGLDGLRALGALFVVTTHVGFTSGDAVNGPFKGLLARMDSGVALFFVLSGFLLFRPHVIAWFGERTAPDLGTYARHRVLRIMPPLLIAVVAAMVLLPWEDATWFNYLAHATFLQIYLDDMQTNGLTQMWSLSTEVAFYVALPVVAYVLVRPPKTVPDRRAVLQRLGLLLATPLLGASWMALGVAVEKPNWGLWLPGFIGWFGLGMALALWQVSRALGVLRFSIVDEAARHPWTTWTLAVGIFLVAGSPIAGPYTLVASTPTSAFIKSLLYAIFAALVILPAVGVAGEEDPAPVRALGGRVGKFLGDISYGIFCYHLIVLYLTERAMNHQVFGGNFWQLWVSTVVGSIILASISFYGLERPLMRRARQADRRQRPSDAPATAVSARN